LKSVEKEERKHIQKSLHIRTNNKQDKQLTTPNAKQNPFGYILKGHDGLDDWGSRV
jgi:hypothetical protein